MSLELHRPDGRGGLEPQGTTPPDYREQLRNPRWGAARRGRRLPGLGNPEMRPTSALLSVAFWLGLAAATFIAILAGYGLGIWSFAPPA